MKPRWPKLTGLVTGHQMPLIEWQPPNWIVWINYNTEVSAGTYLVLKQAGRIERCTLAPTGEVQTVTVKP